MSQDKEKTATSGIIERDIEVAGKTFTLPREVTYRQYHKMNELLKKATIPLDEAIDQKESVFTLAGGDSTLKVGLHIGKIIQNFIQQDILPDVLATILVPKGEKWNVSMIADNREVMYDLGDETIVGIVRDFLAGRGNLISTIMTSLPPLQKEKKESSLKSKE